MTPVLLAAALLAPAQAAPDDAPSQPPDSPAVESLSADEQAELTSLRHRVGRLEDRLAEAEDRLEQLDHERAAGTSTLQSFQGTGAVVVQAGESVSEAVAFGGPLDIHGRVEGSAVSFGGDVRVHNGAFIEGDAVSFGGEVYVDDGAAIEGNQITLGQSAAGSLLGATAAADQTTWLQALARRLVVLLSFAGAGVMVVGLFPRQVDTVARTIATHPVRSGLLGVLLTGLAAILTIVLAATLIGIPVSLFIAVVVALAWLLGFIGLCQAAGDLLPLDNRGARRWLAFLLGVFALSFISSLPVVGKLALILMSLICIGAALQTRLGNREFLD